MSPAVDRRQTAVDVVFVLAEALAWYVILHVGATAMQQSYLLDLKDRVRMLAPASELAGGRLAEVLVLIDEAAKVEHGPSLVIILATALGGFYVMRALRLAGFDGPLGAVVLIASSLLALNVLLHLALLGDVRVWDPSGIAALFGGSSELTTRAGLDAFVGQPNLGRPHGSAVTFVFAGLIALWVRFVIAGRGRVTFERVMRSFTVAFLVTIVGLTLASFTGLRTVALFAVPQFVLGILGLAISNNARTAAPIDGAQRVGPWMASVSGTVGLLLGVALLLGTLSFLNVGALLAIVGDLAWSIFAAVLIIVVTPIYWLIERILHLLLPNGPAGFPRLPNIDMRPPPDLMDQARTAAEAGGLALWLQNGLRFLAVLVIGWALYRLALLIMRRGRAADAPVDEVRGRVSSGTGIGGLLRGVMARVRPPTDETWLRRQSIYRLYARAAAAAEERGFHYRLSETPLEYTARADRAMGAPPFPPIGAAFDRARYGRHAPDEGRVRSLEAALGSWEAATPPTEELRQRLAGSQPLSATQEFMLHWAARRQAIESHRNRSRGAPPPPEDRSSRQSSEHV